MKKRFILEHVEEPEFSVFAINSHAKGYKLCWNINKTLGLNFEKKEDQIINKEMRFSRYECITEEGFEYNILTNRSKKGYLIPDQKSINYFLIVNNKARGLEKEEVIVKLKANKEVLFVFELNIEKSKYIDRFIFNDKKN